MSSFFSNEKICNRHCHVCDAATHQRCMSYDAAFHQLSNDIWLLCTFQKNGGDVSENLNALKNKNARQKSATRRRSCLQLNAHWRKC